MSNFNRLVATGLLALMIASFGACDEINKEYIENSVITDSQGNIVGVRPPEDMTNSGSVDAYNELKGSIWAEVVKSGAMIGDHVSSNEILDQGLPITFLEKEGLIYKNDYGEYGVNGPVQPNDRFNLFQYRAYIDSDSAENDIYLLVQYASNYVGESMHSKDVYLVTYMLEYELDDDNYETFLKLDGDRLNKHFVQEMDKQFEERVIFKTIVTQEMQSIGSCVSDKQGTSQAFPNIFVANVDYNNAIITYGTRDKNGIKYYDASIRESAAWEKVMDWYTITEEERENSINMSTIDTPVGKCLTSFAVKDIVGGFSAEKAQALRDASNRLQELEPVDINSRDKILSNGR